MEAALDDPQPLEVLLDRARVLAQVDGRACPIGQLREAMEVHAELIGRIEAEALRWVDAFDAGCVAGVDGARSTGAWLAARTELAADHAHAWVHRARDLRRCPSVAAAYADGTLGTAKVKALLTARQAHPVLFAEHEAELVATIAPLTVAHARIAAARWRDLAEATVAFEQAQQAAASGTGDGEPEPPIDPAEANSFTLSQTTGGRWYGELDLDPLAGAELAEAIAAAIDARFHQGSYRSDDGLSARRRRAEELVELARRGSVASTRHGDPRPSVIARIDPETLAGHPASSLAEGLERECGLDDGTPLHPRALERLLCTCRIQALWTRLREDGTVETLGVTDLLRDATRAQRRALKQRDGRCVFPGCSAVAEWCDAHHVHPAEDLGPTLLHNLVLLCRFHHHLVHEGGWTLWRDASDDELHLVDPQWRPVELVPHGQKLASPAAQASAGASPPSPPPPPPHLRPPRFRTAHDPPWSDAA